jgi:hypothetical protein
VNDFIILKINKCLGTCVVWEIKKENKINKLQNFSLFKQRYIKSHNSWRKSQKEKENRSNSTSIFISQILIKKSYLNDLIFLISCKIKLKLEGKKTLNFDRRFYIVLFKGFLSFTLFYVQNLTKEIDWCDLKRFDPLLFVHFE